MKNKFLKLTLSTFCILALAGCANNKDNNSNSQTNSSTPSSQEVSSTTSESTSNSTSSKDECATMFTVTFYLNDGTENIYKTLEVKSGTKIKRPDAPVKEGFKFKGWFVDKDCLVENNYALPIISDFDLYAKWVSNEDINSSTSEDASSDNQSSVDSSSGTSSDSIDSSVPEGITYTFEHLPSWIDKDGCVIFAWVWSDTNKGEWVETTLDVSDSNNKKVSFVLEDEFSKMLLARCKAGTTVPNWDEKGDNVGRIYNKTKDIDIKAGITNYDGSENIWIKDK